MNRTKSTRASILTLVLILVALPLTAGPVAESDQSSTAISWQPQIAWSSAQLTVSGPGGQLFEKTFDSGLAPTWSVFDSSGFAWPDGSYTYELRLTPAGGVRQRPEGADQRAVTDGKGNFPNTVAYGYFTIVDGLLANPYLGNDNTDQDINFDAPQLSVQPKDQVILDDLIVDGSICAGFDCVNGESFGFDTLRLKENNLRVRFQDTSSSASFPSNDWQITANDSSNGGANKYSIDDIDGGRTPFTIEAGAPSNSLYVEDGGRLGLGTSTPVVDIHVKSGNTPTLRLEQDGSSGFGAQTWDVAGNEANFFIRDASNGSTLPFRIFPGAPSNAITIEASTGDIGLNTTSPDSKLNIEYSDSGDGILVETSDISGTTNLLSLKSGARPRLEMVNGSAANGVWNFDVLNITGDFAFINSVTAQTMTLAATSGNMTITGNYFSTLCVSGSPCAPDYVFEDDYDLLVLEEVRSFINEHGHLPNVPSAEELTGPINMSAMQMTLLEKVEELTLYTLQQQDTITALEARLAALEQAGEAGER